MIPVYQVDAFCSEPFKGNPAAVVPLESWPDDSLLQNIAAEFNLSETAFIVRNENGYHLRWFTPTIEVRLCGHATLASAHVIFQHMNYSHHEIVFSTEGAGNLKVTRKGFSYLMDFPADMPQVYNDLNQRNLINQEIRGCYKGMDDIMIILETEKDVLECEPELAEIKQLDARALIISAPGNEVDFVSRVFAPACGVDEDPVTGSAHTLMTPYWAKRLSKQELTARQVSKRRGDLICKLQGDRVLLSGSAVTILTGELNI